MFAIGEASRRSGVSIETIRYYEREGIIARAARSGAGRRLYNATDISELSFIKRCRGLGFSIRDVRALRSLSGGAEGACTEVEMLGRRQLSDVRDKIADLAKIEAALQELVGNCQDGNTQCPMLQGLLAADRLAP